MENVGYYFIVARRREEKEISRKLQSSRMRERIFSWTTNTICVLCKNRVINTFQYFDRPNPISRSSSTKKSPTIESKPGNSNSPQTSSSGLNNCLSLARHPTRTADGTNSFSTHLRYVHIFTQLSPLSCHHCLLDHPLTINVSLNAHPLPLSGPVYNSHTPWRLTYLPTSHPSELWSLTSVALTSYPAYNPHLLRQAHSPRVANS